MKIYNPWRFVFICCSLLLAGCSSNSPRQYFDRAVLNTNMLVGFAGNGELRQLESPSATMGENGEVIPLKRTVELESRIAHLKDAFKKVKSLKETDETKNLLRTSVALYQHVLPVYDTEYMQLAKMYDEGVSKEKIEALARSIHEKYYLRFDELYSQLIGHGKVYAEKHHIEVNWNVGG